MRAQAPHLCKRMLLCICALLATGMGGCTAPIHVGPPEAATLDFSALPRATASGTPLVYTNLPLLPAPEAVQCQPVWEPLSKPSPATETQVIDGLHMTTTAYTNSHGQILTERSCYNHDDDSTYREFYHGRQLILRELPWRFAGEEREQRQCCAEWIGKDRILVRSAWSMSGLQVFFVYDAARKTIQYLQHGELVQRPVEGGMTSQELWELSENKIAYRLAGHSGDGRRLFVYAREDADTTLLEYNLALPEDRVVLLEHLPPQSFPYLEVQADGGIWLAVDIEPKPERVCMAYRYDSATRTLEPVLRCGSGYSCYFYKEAVLVHGSDSIGIWHYGDAAAYEFDSDVDMYAITSLGPGEHESILYYNYRSDEMHFLWDLVLNRRYAISTADLEASFPGEGKMTYFHGTGYFHWQIAEDNTSREGYLIHWDRAIQLPTALQEAGSELPA